MENLTWEHWQGGIFVDADAIEVSEDEAGGTIYTGDAIRRLYNYETATADSDGCHICVDGIKKIHAEMSRGQEWNGEKNYINYCFNCGKKLTK